SVSRPKVLEEGVHVRIDTLRNAVLRQPEMQDRGRGNAHFRRHFNVRLEKPEMVEHWVFRRKIDLAGNADALWPGLDSVKFDAAVEDHLLATDEAPIKVEMPPRAAVFAVGRELEPDVLLLLDDVFDVAVFDPPELVRSELALLAFGPRLLDGGA